MSSQGVYVFPVSSKPYGLTYEEWTVRWWRWLCSIPKASNPAFDSTGNHLLVQQQDSKVLFLCQTIENSKDAPHRKAVLFERRAIFMPIINWISIESLDGNTEDELRSTAKQKMDIISGLELEINGFRIGQDLRHFRIASPFFDIELPNDNIFDTLPGKKRSFSDGYWILFQPVSEMIRISSFGSCSSGATQIRVDYELTMK